MTDDPSRRGRERQPRPTLRILRAAYADGAEFLAHLDLERGEGGVIFYPGAARVSQGDDLFLTIAFPRSPGEVSLRGTVIDRDPERPGLYVEIDPTDFPSRDLLVAAARRD